MQFPSFITSLQARHQTALESRQLVYIPTQVFHLQSKAGIRSEIRFAPSLAEKPVVTSDAQQPSDSRSGSFDPFAPPYIPELFICESEESQEGEDSYVVLLNKFCVVPRHFLLVTKTYKSQTSPPTPEDLSAIYSVLQQAQKSDLTSEWISFFNCGHHSGASQPHRHFQFIPVEIGGNPFGDLIKRSAPPKIGDVYNIPELGYAHFACAIPSDLGNTEETEEKLGEFFMTMLDSMIDHLRHLPSSQDNNNNKSTSTSSTTKDLSYNFLMTLNYMILVPRSRERFLSGDGLSVNSLGVCAGMVLVKSLDELDLVRKVGIDEVLKEVTVPVLKDVINPCDHG